MCRSHSSRRILPQSPGAPPQLRAFEVPLPHDRVSRDLASRGLASRDLASRGLASRGLASRGLASRGLGGRELGGRELGGRELGRGGRSWWVAALVFLLSLSPARFAAAHPSGYRAGDAWWQAWHFDPLVVFNLGLLAAVFGWGLRRLWRRAGIGRGVARWQVAAFASGLLALAVALLSPLDVLSDDLSWVHMSQHMLLMTVAAPLLVLGAPGLVGVWALPRRWRQPASQWPRQSALGGGLWRLSWNPWLAWLLHAAVLWGWHLPVLYQAALRDPLVHDVEHLSFFGVACLFWRVAIDPRSQLRLNSGLGVLYLFTTSLHTMVLGVFMTLSPRLWYPIYGGRTERWNLSPLEDQQLAGLIMWMPGCAAYTVAAAALFAAWLRELERRSEARNRLASSEGTAPAAGSGLLFGLKL